MKHTPGPWKINHFSHNSSSGLKCEGVKGCVTYFSADGVTENFYQIVAEIEPTKHPLQGDFQGAHICRLIDFRHQGGEFTIKANAHLIAAAPDLLAALHAVRRHGLEQGDGYESIIKLIGDAINKAEQP